MKKLLFVIHDLHQGGAEKVLVNLVNNLDSKKYDITLFSIFDVGVNKQFLQEHITYKSHYNRMFRGNAKYFQLFSAEKLFRKLFKDKYDIIVSYLEGPTARIVSGCTDSDTRLISWIHGQQHTKARATASYRSFKEASNAYNKFDRTICVSEDVKNDFKSIFNITHKCEVLYNTNETDDIVEASKEKDELDVISKNTFNLIGVGKIEKEKGFDRLARIHHKLQSEGESVSTYILGEGSGRNKINQYLNEHSITNFHFLGYKTNPYKYLANCDLFVCASFAEGFSTAATEALIVGTPVVSTLVAGMKEMLGSDNEFGIITENDEGSLYFGIKDLIANPEKYEKYKKAAEKRGRYFNKKNTVNAVEGMLDSL